MRSRPTEQERAVGRTFEDDWDQHWEAYASSAAVNPAQEFRRRLVLQLLGEITPTSRVLDIGSGTGDLAVALREAYPSVELLGLELSRRGVELSREKVSDATFVQLDLLVTQAPPVEYRTWATHAVCSEVLEHLDDPKRLLVNCSAFLAPGCMLVVTVPGGPMTAYDKHIGHRRHFSPAELAALLSGAGFEVVRATGAGFPFFNLYRLLVRALGQRLIALARSESPSTASRAVGRVFDALLGINLHLSERGWQVVAVARLPRTDP